MSDFQLIEIKSITPNRYVLKVKKDSQEEKLTLMSETLLEMGLFKPKELTKDEYQKLKDSSVIDDLKSKAIHYISFQARLVNEVVTFLEKKEASKKQIQQIISELKHAGLLDDERYIKSIIDSAVQYDYDGPYKVREKLIKKGANISLVDHYLASYTTDVQMNKLRELMSKECKYKMKKPISKMNQTLKQRFITKGYSIELVGFIVEEFKEDIRAQIDEEYLLLQDLKRMPKQLFEKKNKQKLIAKLMRLGYSYSLIKENTKGGNDDENYE